MKTVKLILLITAVTFVSTSCRKGGPWGIKGKGENKTETRNLSGFDKIHLSIEAEVFYMQDSVYKVEISAQQNILAVLKAEVENGILKFDYKRNVWDHNEVKITVHSPNIHEFDISGSGKITAENTLKTDALEINISGSGDVYIPALNAKSLKGTVSGSGEMKISGGTLTTETFNISGSGDIEASNLVAQSSVAKISGSGDMEINVVEKLDATISGSGSIKYKGNPTIKVDISGSGKLGHID